MIINDLDGYYIVFDTKNWNTELDTLINYSPVYPLSIWPSGIWIYRFIMLDIYTIL